LWSVPPESAVLTPAIRYTVPNRHVLGVSFIPRDVVAGLSLLVV
jgi:hypothetical protein